MIATRLMPFPDNNRHLFQTVGPRCLVALKQSEGGCAAIMPGGAAPIDREQAAPPYPLHRLSLGIGIIPPADPVKGVETSFAGGNAYAAFAA
jgi:hypothetical protein